MTVCSNCAKLGEEIKQEPEPRHRHEIKKPKKKYYPVYRPKPVKKPKRKSLQLDDDYEIVEDYNILIKERRQKLGLSQQELAQQIGERLSVLQAIETKRIIPENKTIKKLERVLGISLRVEIPDIPIKIDKKDEELTLGDVVKIKRRTK